MKNYIFLLIALLTVVACSKQQSSQEQDYKSNKVTVTGTMTIPADVPAIDQMMVYLLNEDLADYDEFKSIVDNDGNFNIEVKLDKPKQLVLMGNSQIFFMAVPGDSIHITFNDSGVPGALATDVVFSGDRAETNNVLTAYEKNKPLDSQRLEQIYQEETATAFTAYMDAQTPALITYMDKSLKQHKNDLYLKEYIMADQKYAILNTKLTFNAYAGARGLQVNDMLDLTEILENLPTLEMADFINTQQTSQFLYYIAGAMRTKTSETLTDKSTPEDGQAAFLNTVSAIKDNALLKSKMVYRSAINDFESNGITFFENNKEAIKNLVIPAAYTALAKRYKETKNLLENPSIPNNAQLLKFNSTDATAYLDEIIANAKGKVIYIDNWATWCGPCKQEFQQASPALYAKFKDQVEFVYLCHQSDPKGYEPSIAKYKIAGKHYFLTQQESMPVFQQLNLQGFPTYTIINKKGEIASSDTTYRPSYPGTSEVLTKLINE